MVESADDYLAKAQALGAQVTVGKVPVPGMGWFAHLVDPRATPSPSFRTTLPPPERA
jgi:predicted enzyme related to lactoylglutathione lyase